MIDLSLETRLDNLLKRVKEDAPLSLAIEDINTLATAFSDTSKGHHSKAYIILSAYCHPAASVPPIRPTEEIVATFRPPILSFIEGTSSSNAITGLNLFVALFQVDALAASQIFVSEGIYQSLMELRDMFSEPLLLEGLVRLLGQAVSKKNCRTIITDECISWLQHQVQNMSGERIRAAAVVALVKLRAASNADPAEMSQNNTQTIPHEANNIDFMRRQLITSRDHNVSAELVEGLAYASRQPEVKETLSKDGEFLKVLLGLVPQNKSAAAGSLAGGSTLLFGIVTIILNIVSYRPRLTGEQAQVERLRRMANAGPGASGKLEDQTGDKLDDEAFVQARGRRLLGAGAHTTLVAAIRLSESRGVRLAAGNALRHLIEEKQNRGIVLQAGSAKALMTIVRPLRPETAISEDLECVQALAKLAITSSPIQVFGADEGIMIDAIRPFSVLLTHPLSNLLQQFESLMALTNLSSQGSSLAERIATAEGLSNKVEILLLEDHVLVRRAATELICNLVAGSESMFNKYSSSKSKLQILVALGDVEDDPTRLASSGALAALTTSPKACSTLCELQFESHRTLSLLVQLLDSTPILDDDNLNTNPSNPGLIHRGVICLRNLFMGTPTLERERMAVEAERASVVKALVGIVRASQNNQSDPPFLLPAAEALKWLLESGVTIQV